MGKKLFVGNLPFSTTEMVLNEMFQEAGQVESVRLITDRSTGTSKGFGFVEMASDEEAAIAVSTLNGTQLEGRAMNVTEARPLPPRTPETNSRTGKGFSRGPTRAGSGGFRRAH